VIAVTAQQRYEAVAAAPSDIQAHLPLLRREARGTVLELGVRGGNSTAALLAGVEERGGAVWSVDVDAGSATIFDGHPSWRFVLADSRDANAVEAHGLAGQLDVLFVDTLHSYEQVRDELRTWGDRVRPGGIVLFHDTESYPEIRRAIVEWCRPRKAAYEFLTGSNGLGVAYPGRNRAFRRRATARRVVWRGQRAAAWSVAFPGRVVGRLRRTLAR
jgi:predicted O-methyltransferase YrrM